MLAEQIKKDITEEILPEFKAYFKTLEGKTVLVTGGTGFLPSYLVDAFVLYNEHASKPIQLIIMHKSDFDENSRLGHLLSDKNVTFVQQDVGKPFEVPGKPNVIIHAASRANPSAFLADPLDTIDANINGMRVLLEHAKQHPVDSFLLFSSNEIYGNPLPEFIPTPETYPGNIDCLDKWACYTEAKRLAESLGMIFFRTHKVPIKIARILLAYGPGMKDDGKVMSDFFKSAYTTGKIPIRDQGAARRSFCYATEAARQLFLILAKGNVGEAYNVGDDTNNVSIKELADMIAHEVSPQVSVEPNMNAPPKKMYGVDNRKADMTKMRALGYIPRIGLEEGLKRLGRYYRQTGMFQR